MGIHAYLGIHVLARKVIFVDLALAQIAGLGAVYGVFLGLSFEADPWIIKAISVTFTLLGALLITVTRTRDEQIPHERSEDRTAKPILQSKCLKAMLSQAGCTAVWNQHEQTEKVGREQAKFSIRAQSPDCQTNLHGPNDGAHSFRLLIEFPVAEEAPDKVRRLVLPDVDR